MSIVRQINAGLSSGIAEAFKIWGGKLRPEGPNSEARRAESRGVVLVEEAASPLRTS